MKNQFEISNEFKVYCYFNGIKLIRPDKTHEIQPSPFFYDTGHTVSSILNLPLVTTFLNHDGNTVTINELSVATSGFNSIKDAIGKSILDVTKRKSGKVIMQHNRDVIDTQQKMLLEESIIRKNHTDTEVITVKSPWYNHENKVIGLFGCGLNLEISPLAESLSLIAKVGLLRTYEQPPQYQHVMPGMKINNVYYTKRQCDVLKHIVRGKSAKSIASALNLSPRTIESYLSQIKAKSRTSSKSELIDIMFDHFT